MTRRELALDVLFVVLAREGDHPPGLFYLQSAEALGCTLERLGLFDRHMNSLRKGLKQAGLNTGSIPKHRQDIPNFLRWTLWEFLKVVTLPTQKDARYVKPSP